MRAVGCYCWLLSLLLLLLLLLLLGHARPIGFPSRYSGTSFVRWLLWLVHFPCTRLNMHETTHCRWSLAAVFRLALLQAILSQNVRVFLHPFCQLIEKKSSLEPHFANPSF